MTGFIALSIVILFNLLREYLCYLTPFDFIKFFEPRHVGNVGMSDVKLTSPRLVTATAVQRFQ